MKKTIIRNILKVFAVGSTAVGMGMGTMGLAALSVAIYCNIPAASGYAAVAAFALATITLAAALLVVYMCGCWIARTGKFSR